MGVIGTISVIGDWGAAEFAIIRTRKKHTAPEGAICLKFYFDGIFFDTRKDLFGVPKS